MINQCPLCNTTFQEDHIAELAEQANSKLVHMTCHVCKHSVVTMIVQSPFGSSSIGMVTDLDANDLRRGNHIDTVSENELFDLHTTLQNEPEHFIHSLMNHTL